MQTTFTTEEKESTKQETKGYHHSHIQLRKSETDRQKVCQGANPIPTGLLSNRILLNVRPISPTKDNPSNKEISKPTGTLDKGAEGFRSRTGEISAGKTKPAVQPSSEQDWQPLIERKNISLGISWANEIMKKVSATKPGFQSGIGGRDSINR